MVLKITNDITNIMILRLTEKEKCCHISSIVVCETIEKLMYCERKLIFANYTTVQRLRVITIIYGHKIDIVIYRFIIIFLFV